MENVVGAAVEAWWAAGVSGGALQWTAATGGGGQAGGRVDTAEVFAQCVLRAAHRPTQTESLLIAAFIFSSVFGALLSTRIEFSHQFVTASYCIWPSIRNLHSRPHTFGPEEHTL